MPDPRTIAESKNTTKPAGEPAYCGACGTPTKDCVCASYREHGAEPREGGGNSAAFEAEGSSFKGG